MLFLLKSFVSLVRNRESKSKHKVRIITISDYQGEMKRMLDGMALTLEGSPEYDNEYFARMTECFDSVNVRLVEAQVKLYSS